MCIFPTGGLLNHLQVGVAFLQHFQQAFGLGGLHGLSRPGREAVFVGGFFTQRSSKALRMFQAIQMLLFSCFFSKANTLFPNDSGKHVTWTSDIHPSVSATLQSSCHRSSPIHIDLLKDRGLSQVNEWNVKGLIGKKPDIILSSQTHLDPISCFLLPTYLLFCLCAILHTAFVYFSVERRWMRDTVW